MDIIHEYLKSEHVDPVELLLNISPAEMEEVEQCIRALSLDELKYTDPKYGDK